MPFRIVEFEADGATRALAHVLRVPNQAVYERERQVRWFIEYARRLNRDLKHNWLAMDGDRVIAGCHCMPCPGRTAIIFITDGRIAGAEDGVLTDLARRALDVLDTIDVRLAQVLLHPDDRPGRESMLRAGFSDLTTLLYMERRLDYEQPRPLDPAMNEQWVEYDAQSHSAFASFIEHTYEGSLDCPKLTGLRHIGDILEGHKGAGIFRPHRWRLLIRAGHPVACILLGENPLRSVVEIVYMGVSPKLRGQNEGSRVLADACFRSWREGFSAVTLAVDSANTPAVSLYQRAGFEVTLERVAMIRAMHPSA
jgi:ribosomal protein S18 acetylase RimI-like enzyme